MGQWSDGRERSDEYKGSALQLAIIDYFEVPLNLEIAYLRQAVAEMRSDKKKFKAAEDNKAMAAIVG